MQQVAMNIDWCFLFFNYHGNFSH